MSKECIHGLGDVHENEIGEKCLFCEEWNLDRNISLGDCLGNCESQKPEESDEVTE